MQQRLLSHPRGSEKRIFKDYEGVPRVGGIPGLHARVNDLALRQRGQCATALGRPRR